MCVEKLAEIAEDMVGGSHGFCWRQTSQFTAAARFCSLASGTKCAWLAPQRLVNAPELEIHVTLHARAMTTAPWSYGCGCLMHGDGCWGWGTRCVVPRLLCVQYCVRACVRARACLVPRAQAAYVICIAMQCTCGAAGHHERVRVPWLCDAAAQRPAGTGRAADQVRCTQRTRRCARAQCVCHMDTAMKLPPHLLTCPSRDAFHGLLKALEPGDARMLDFMADWYEESVRGKGVPVNSMKMVSACARTHVCVT